MILDNLYYLTFVWLIVLMIIAKRKNKNVKLFLLALLPLIFISTFRFGQGMDYFSYEYLYNNQQVTTFGTMLDHQDRFELGFRIFIFIFKKMGMPFQVFVAFLSGTILVFLAKWIYDNSDKPILSLTMLYGMFYLVWVLSALRQGFVLAIGTYLFLSKERKVNNIWIELLIIIMLSFMHISAFVFLLLLVLRNMKVSQKQLIIIFIFTLVSTFIPWLDFARIILPSKLYYKFASQLGNGNGFFDFPGLVRLMFTLYSFYLLNRYDWDAYQYKIISATIVGFSAYFLFKFNEVNAGRLSIYTFILYPVIFSWHLTKEKKELLNHILKFAMICFALVYFQKDAQSGQYFQGSLQPTKTLKFKTVFESEISDYWHYDNPYSFYTYYYKLNENQLRAFKKNNKQLVDSSYTKEIIATKSLENKKYGILNSGGNWVIEPKFNENIEVMGDVLRLNKNDNQHEIEFVEYYDIFSRYDHHSDLLSAIDLENKETQRIHEIEPDPIIKNEVELRSMVDELMPNSSSENLENMRLYYLSAPFPYHILQFKYFNFNLSVYLDENLELLSDNLYFTANKFQNNRMVKNKSFHAIQVMNEHGEIINYE